MKKLIVCVLFVLVIMACCVSQVVWGALTATTNSSGIWTTPILSPNSYKAVTAEGVAESGGIKLYSRAYAARNGGGVDMIYQEDGPAWRTQQIAPGNYTKLTRDGTRPRCFFATGAAGTDLVMYSAEVWTTININTNQYSDIIYGNSKYLWCYGAGPTTLDIIYYDAGSASYKTDPIATATYVALAQDGNPDRTPWVYGARSGGGLDAVYYSGGWATAQITTGTSYTALSGDAVRSLWVYAAGPSGLDVVYYGGDNVWHVTNLNTNQYVALTPDASRQYCVYGARANGGLDVILNSSEGWLTIPIASSGMYTGVSRDPARTLWVYGANNSVPPAVGANNKAMLDWVMQQAASSHIWVIWGKATVTDADNFVLDDGSGVNIAVYAPGHGVANGDYVSVRGTYDPVAVSFKSQEIVKY